MPLLVGSPLPPPPPPPAASAPGAGSINAVWIAPTPTQEQLPLSDQREQVGWFTLPGIVGLGALPIELVTDPHPRGGTTVRHIHEQPRDIHWPLHIYGDTHMQFTHRWRTVVRLFTATKRYGPGILRVSRPDGTSRQISAYYSDGLRGEPGQNWLSASPVITLHCPDGYFNATEPVTGERSNQVAVDYYDPYTSISPSQIIGESTLFNAGDTEAWPEWTLIGPAEKLTATNTTTGQSFILTHTLDEGEQITIATHPPRVRGPAGQNLTSALNWPGAVLWALAPGRNDVLLQVDGAEAETVITYSFTPRFESA